MNEQYHERRVPIKVEHEPDLISNNPETQPIKGSEIEVGRVKLLEASIEIANTNSPLKAGGTSL